MGPTRAAPQSQEKNAVLTLEDGSVWKGSSFGFSGSAEGEVVFNTGMVGYPEAFTDPSYRGQMLVLTYPLIGNYGVPAQLEEDLSQAYESSHIHFSGLVVSEYSRYHHHWTAQRDLSSMLVEMRVMGIQGIDTRALTKVLRAHGTMRGTIACGEADAGWCATEEPRHLVTEVSTKTVRTYRARDFGATARGKRISLIDCGCKNTIVRSLLVRGVDVVRLPWDAAPHDIDADGVLISNGPGDPTACAATITTTRALMERGFPIFGICLGSEIIALAAGAKTYKLKFGHRSQNQPCRLDHTPRIFITSQNHGYAVDTTSLPEGWEPWFTNANDGTNEGVRHRTKAVMGVQFHPEAMPGPVDTGFLFDEFVALL